MKADKHSSGQGRNGHAAAAASHRSAAADALSGAFQELHEFIGDLEELIEATTSLTGEDLAHAKSELKARIAAAKQAAGQMHRGVAERARRRIKVVDSYVQEQPWKSIGIGVAAGLLVGVLISRGRS
jgi:DNA phosphorothioation-dependent restriction protein DptG